MKYIYIIGAVVGMLLTSCGDNFLSRDNLYEKDLDSYYKTPEDVDEALVGAYSCMSLDQGVNHPFTIADIRSDDCFSGGGTHDVIPQELDKFVKSGNEDNYIHIYSRTYLGISRINSLLERIENVVYDDDADGEKLAKQQYGEARFLRAFYYFKLAQIFGEVPLQLKSNLQYLSKASAEEIYAQIATDMSAAIENLPADPYSQAWADDNSGRATKWAAQGLMARIYLFYTGYYGQSSLPLVGEGSIENADVVAMLESCIAESGHGLLDDFQSIWPYSYLNEGDESLPQWAKDGHKETLFATKYTNQGNWGGTGIKSNTNQHPLNIGVKETVQISSYGQGWGFAQVSPVLEEAMYSDPRYTLSIADLGNNKDYEFGKGQLRDETGLYNRKYMPIVVDDEGATVGMYTKLYGGLVISYMMWNMQDDIILRFADVLLMHSELTGDATGIDAVRARVGLPSVGADMDAIKHERRMELAMEGIRYYDLLRWGDAEQAIGAANGTIVKRAGIDEVYNVTFMPERAFLPLPESQIRLSQGLLEQNEGWE